MERAIVNCTQGKFDTLATKSGDLIVLEDKDKKLFTLSAERGGEEKFHVTYSGVTYKGFLISGGRPGEDFDFQIIGEI